MNEVNMLNIGGVDYNIDDQYARDLIAHSENGLDSQSNLPISSRHYDEGEYLIGQDRYYYEATTDIDPGDVLAEGTNLRKTILSDEIVSLKNQSSIAVIQCIAKRETGALATSSYPIIGSYLYWDFGLTAGLYETIAAITAGDALTIGVNLKSANKIADTMDGLQDAYNITGAKNLCPNEASDTTTTDITWDVLSDGSIQVSGTPAANRFLELGYVTLPPGTYKVTTLAGQDEENSRVWLTVYAGSGYSTVIARSNSSSGTPNTFTLAAEATCKMALNVSSGAAINTRVFPMCRVASITDETYVPYAMTNKQLTDNVNSINSKMNATKLDSRINITSVSLPYTFPNDGYVVMHADWPSGNYTQCQIGGSTGQSFWVTQLSVGNNNVSNEMAVFVKKGMRLVNRALSNQYGSLGFYPLI